MNNRSIVLFLPLILLGIIAAAVLMTPVVAAGDFTIAANPTAVTLAEATNAPPVTITVAPVAAGTGFTGTVDLSLLVVPKGLSCSLALSRLVHVVTSNTTTLSCQGNSAGSYTATVTGNSTINGVNVQHSVAVSYTVTTPKYQLVTNPTRPNGTAGQTTTTTTVTVTALNGFTGTVNLAAVGQLACSFTPSSITLGASGTSTMRCGGPNPGQFVETVNGTSTSGGFVVFHQAQAVFGLHGLVCLADPILSTTANACPTPAQAFTGPLLSDVTTLTPSGVVQLRVAVNVNASASLNGFDIILSSKSAFLKPFDADTTGSVVPSTANILVKCIGGVLVLGPVCSSQDNITTIHLSEAASNFLSPSTTTGLLFTAVFNVVGNVPSGTIPVVFQTGCGTPQLPTSTPPFCVIIENGGGASVPEGIQTATFNTAAAAGQPFFTLSLTTSSFNLLAGASVSSANDVAMNEGNGFTCFGINCVDLAVLLPLVGGNPVPGLTATVSPTAVSDPLLNVATLNIGTSGSTPVGTYTIFIVGRPDTTNLPSTGVVYLGAVAAVTLTVGDLKLTPLTNPLIIQHASTGNTGLDTIRVTNLGSFGLTSITLQVCVLAPPTCSGPLPAGVTATLNQTSIASLAGGASHNVTLRVGVSSTVPAGSFTVTVRAIASGQLRSTTVTVTVPSPDFTMSATLTDVKFASGGTNSTTLNFQAVSEFTGSVVITSSVNATAGLLAVACTSPVSVGPSNTTVFTSPCTFSSSTAGNYRVTFNGTSGALLHQVFVTVHVTGAGVVKPVVTITNLSPNPGVIGQTVTVTFTTTNAPTSVTVKWGDGTATDSLAGTATSDTHTYAVSGTAFVVNVTATNSAGTGFATQNEAVNKRTTSTAVSCPASVVIAQSISCTVTVTDTNGVGATTPSGTVNLVYTAGLTGPATCTLTAAGTCSISVTGAVPAGTATVTGNYQGDTVHLTSSGTSGNVTVSLRSTSTAVSCPASVVIAQSISCTVTVTDTAGTGATTPSGTVNLVYTAGLTGPASCTLTAAGTCSITVTGASPAGIATVTGNYAGDTVHATSSGTSGNVTVSLRSTSTAVSCPASVVIAQSISCTVTVTDTAGTGATTPSGTVNLVYTAGLTGPASCTLTAAGTCSITVTGAAPAGTATVTGNYAGDTVHATSSGTSGNVTVNLRSTSTAVSCPASVVIAQSISCTVTVTDTAGTGATTPSGTVNLVYTAGLTGPATCTLTAAGTCSISVTGAAPAGTATVTGNYAGDTVHATSSGTSGIVSVNKRTTSTAVSCPATVVIAQSISCTVTVTDTNGIGATTPSGTVNLVYTAGLTGPATCTLTAAGTCSISVTGAAPAGTATVTGNYAGDTVHATSSGTSGNVTVSLRSTSTAVSCPASVVIAQSILCTVTVTDTNGVGATTPSGTVNLVYTAGLTGPASCTLTAAGTCSITVTGAAPAGTATVTGNYAGDTVHATSSGTSGNVTVSLRSTSTAVSCPASVVIAQSISCTVTVTDTNSVGATTPSGTVNLVYTAGLTGPASCTLTAAGTCSITVTGAAPAGTATVTGNYAGDTVHATSSGTSGNVTVNLRSTSTAVSCPASVVIAQSISCTVTVTDTAGTGATTPSGTVNLVYTAGLTGPASCTLTATGTCSITVTGAAPAGTATVTGSYAGDTVHATSSGTSGNVSVNKRTTSTAVSCPATVVIAQSISCTVTVTDTNGVGATTPSGTVNLVYTAGLTGPASCTLTATGTCSITVTGAAPAGTATVTGSYAGDTVHATSSGTSGNVTVSLRSTSTAVSCPASVVIAQSISCTVTVTDTAGTGATTPSGTVNLVYTAGLTGPASCTLTAAGNCSITVTGAAPAGTATVTGNYAGDTVHATSSGTSGNVTVSLRSTSTAVSCPASVVIAQSISCTVTVTDTSGIGATTPSGTVNLVYTAGLTGPANCILTATGTCSISVTGAAPAGTATVTGNYAGDTVHATSSGTSGNVTVSLRSNSTAVSCPASVVIAQSISCTVTVTDTAGTGATTPSGTVNLVYTAGLTGPAACTLTAAGTCSITVTGAAPAGTATVTGNYAGDTVHATSSGTSGNVTVSLRSTSTAVSCPASVVIAQSISCTVTVTDTAGTGATTPSGTVNLVYTAGLTGPASCTLTATGTCSISVTGAAPAGTATVTGNYQGDTVHATSSGTSGNVTVSLRSTSTAVSCPASVVIAQSISCTVTVTDTAGTGATTPSGTVNIVYSAGLTGPASCALTATGTCSITVTGTAPAGTATVTGNYAGDTVHATSSGTSGNVSVNKRTTATAVSCPATVVIAQSISCTVTVTDTNGVGATTPSGTVNLVYTAGLTGPASCTLTVAGTCSITVTGAAPAGTATVTGNYAGDTVHATSSGTSGTISVTLRTTQTIVVCSPSSPLVGQATTCTAFVKDTSGAGTSGPTGSVTFTVTPSNGGTFAAPNPCTLATPNATTSSCSVTYTPSAAGVQTITGTYGGSTIHATSQGTFNLGGGNKPTVTITNLSPNPGVIGQAVTVTFTATNAPTSVTVSWGDGTAIDSLPGTATTDTHTYALSGIFTVNVTATNSAGTGFATQSETINKRTTSTAVSCPASVVIAQSISCTVTVTDTNGVGATTPSGTVNLVYTAGLTGPATCTLTATGTCSISVTGAAPAGTATVTGNYAGDTVHATSSGTSGNVTVSLRSTSTAVSCPATVVIAQSISCTVTVTDTNGVGATTPSGTVNLVYTAGLTGPASCTLTATGTCSITVTGAAPAGTATVTGSYAGDTVHATSSGTSGNVSVNKRTTSTAVSCPATVVIAQSISCTVTVTDTNGVGATTPSGTVNLVYTAGLTGPATCTLTAAGTCSITVTGAAPAGTATVTGNYQGDTVHATSSGTSGNVTVSLRSTSTAVSCPASVVIAQSISCTVTVTDTAGTGATTPSGTVNLVYTAGLTGPASCTLTAAGTCSISVTGAAPAGTATVTGNYAGDTVHATSSGTSGNVTVTLRSTSTAVSCPASVVIAQSISCTVTVTDTAGTGATTPSGTVNLVYTAGLTGPASCTLTAAGTCSITVTGAAPAGTATVTGNYAGDTVHATSSGTSGNVTVSLRSTQTIVVCSPSSPLVGQATSCTASVKDTNGAGASAPTGSVTFSVSPSTGGSFTPPNPCGLTAVNGTTSSCSVTYTPSAAGAQTITGTYSGSTIHATSQGAFGLGGGTKPVVTITNLSPNPGVIGQAVTVTFTATNAPTSVTVSWGDGTAIDSLAGTATSDTHTYAVSGTAFVVNVTAINSAGSGFATRNEAINKRTTSTAVSCPASVVIAQSISCTVTVTDTNGVGATTPSGTVNLVYTAGLTGPASCTLTAGTCSITVTGAAPAGTATVTGNYAGDTVHATSSGTSGNVTVNLRTTSTSVSCPASVMIAQSISCTVTVTDTNGVGATTPSGTVNLVYTAGLTGPASCTLTAAGTCSITATGGAPAGANTVTGNYAGDTVHATSSGTSGNVTVSLRSTSTAVSCPASVVIAQSISCTVTVTDTAGTGATTPSGTVNLVYTAGLTGPASCALTATGTCSISVTGAAPAGTATVTGNYAGDTVHATSSGTSGNVTVSLRSTSTILVCSPASPIVGQATSCAASVKDTNGAGASTPGGSVMFSVTPSTGGSFTPPNPCTLVTVNSTTSSCSVTYTPSASGAQTITGVYAPNDSVHSTSQGTFSLGGVQPPVVTITSLTPNPGVIGQPVTVTFTATNSPTSVTVRWGDGTAVDNLPGTATTDSHTYALSGIFTVNVTATNSAGTGFAAQSETVNKRTTSTTVVCSPAMVPIGTPSTCVATVADTNGVTGATTPAGSVSFTSTGGAGTFSTPASCMLTSGSCSVTFTPSSTTASVIIGLYAPSDAVHAASTSSGAGNGSVTGTLRSTSTSISCNTPVTVTQSTTCVATVSDISSGTKITPTGTVMFTTNSTGVFTPSNSCMLSPTGTAGIASCSVTYTPGVVGGHTITGTYGGDSTHTGSSNTAGVAVAPIGTTTTVTCNPATVTVNQASTCTATVTDNTTTSTPTGSVSFFSSGTGTFSPVTMSCTLSGSGSSASCFVTYTPTVFGTGTHTITGTYGGDSTHSGSQGNFPLTVTDFTITPTSPITLPTCNTGSTCNTTIAVMSLNGFTGTIQLTANPSLGLSASFGKTALSLGPGGVNSTQLLLSASVDGTYTVTVTGTSGPLSHTTATITIMFRTVTVDFTLTSNPTNITFTTGGQGTSTITVTPSGGFTGTVTLTAVASSSSITATIVPNMVSGGSGSATLTVTGSVVGDFSVNVTGTSGSLQHSVIVPVHVVTGAKEPVFTQFLFKHRLSLSKSGGLQTFKFGISNPNNATTIFAQVEIDGTDGSGVAGFTLTSAVFTLTPGQILNNQVLSQQFGQQNLGEAWTVTAIIHWGTSPTSLNQISTSSNASVPTSGSFTIVA